MSGADDFLARWSRRKLDRKEAEGRQEDAPEPSSPEAPPGPLDPVVSGEPTLGPDDLLELPTVEELNAESDVAGFLQKGVPEALRNAALRRMWSLDPAIRDFVGDARDYAYDWNAPGSIPGFGPILPTDNAYAMLKTMFSRVGEDAPAEASETDDSGIEAGPAPSTNGEQTPEMGLIAPSTAVDPAASPNRDQPPLAAVPAPIQKASKAPSSEPIGSDPDRPDPSTRPRRHGGAQPV